MLIVFMKDLNKFLWYVILKYDYSFWSLYFYRFEIFVYVYLFFKLINEYIEFGRNCNFKFLSYYSVRIIFKVFYLIVL